VENLASPKTLVFEYLFVFADGTERRWRAELDAQTLDLVELPAAEVPAWARLSFHRCPHCPLAPETHTYCPVARSLAAVIDRFGDCEAHEKVNAINRTHERDYRKQTTIQEGLRSLIGLHMSTSGCPILNRFRPLIRNYLPFEAPEETVLRFLSMYSLAQFFRHRRGSWGDWEMARLEPLLEDVRILERSFCQRLAGVGQGDACVNAVVGLYALADLTSLALEEGLDQVDQLFDAYHDGGGSELEPQAGEYLELGRGDVVVEQLEA